MKKTIINRNFKNVRQLAITYIANNLTKEAEERMPVRKFTKEWVYILAWMGGDASTSIQKNNGAIKRI